MFNRKLCVIRFLVLSTVASAFLYVLLLGFYSSTTTTIPLPVIGPMSSRELSNLSSIRSNAESAESRFKSTYRSCLTAKCFNEKSRVDGSYRIGLLEVPFGGGKNIMKVLQQVNLGPLSSLVYSTNVPPYGYGKNHGWSRIIRIARPIIPHAYDILRPILLKLPADSAEVRSRELFDQQVRQIIRWHCRLSHVAAHTKLLTVFTDDFILHPHVVLKRMIKFATDGAVQQPETRISESALASLLQSLRNEITSTEIMPEYLVEVGSLAILSELSSSQNLTKWPCRPFHSLDRSLPIKPVELAANCSNVFVKCSVKFDITYGQ